MIAEAANDILNRIQMKTQKLRISRVFFIIHSIKFNLRKIIKFYCENSLGLLLPVLLNTRESRETITQPKLVIIAKLFITRRFPKYNGTTMGSIEPFQIAGLSATYKDITNHSVNSIRFNIILLYNITRSLSGSQF